VKDAVAVQEFRGQVRVELDIPSGDTINSDHVPDQGRFESAPRRVQGRRRAVRPGRPV
jgi:hypothetical protein